jgi:hypothetical protein
MIGEVLAYMLGRERGRDDERRRQAAIQAGPVEQDPAGLVEKICVIAIIVSILVVVVLALASA